jgi:hypothetical protein
MEVRNAYKYSVRISERRKSFERWGIREDNKEILKKM